MNCWSPRAARLAETDTLLRGRAELRRALRLMAQSGQLDACQDVAEVIEHAVDVIDQELERRDL